VIQPRFNPIQSIYNSTKINLTTKQVFSIQPAELADHFSLFYLTILHTLQLKYVIDLFYLTILHLDFDEKFI
jgi:hypothetical protein